MNNSSRPYLLLPVTRGEVAMRGAPRYNEAMLLRLALPAALVLSLWACGTTGQNTRARNGLQSYLIALRSNDPRPVYEMLTEEQRQATPFKEWSKRWQESKAEREEQAQHIEKSLRVQKDVDEAAKMQFADGRTISLARAPKGWRLNEALLGRNRADRPDDALNLFATAIRERKVADLLRLLSKRHRDRIETELQALTLGLADTLAQGESAHYLLHETRAELAWNYEGVRYKVVLVKEEGEWLIDDLHIGPDPTLDPEEAAGGSRK